MRRIKFSLLYLSFLFIFTLMFAACGGGSSSSKQGSGSGGSSGSSGSGTSSSSTSGRIITIAADPCADDPGSCSDDDVGTDLGANELPHVTINK